MPRAPEKEVEGRIIAVLDGVTQIGQYQVVVLSLGEDVGMAPGHVLSIYQAGEVVSDIVTEEDVTIKEAVTGSGRKIVQLPEEHAGMLMVFRTYERLSYALVMEATRALHIMDIVKNPSE